MISTTDFKRGARILVDAEPYQLEDYQVQTPSARGAATLVRCKLRHVVTGTLLDRTFKSGEKFEEPDVAFRQVQFLYGDGESSHFMELASYEQFAIANERIEEMVPWLTDGLNLNAVYWNGSVAGISLPQYVEAEIEMVGAGARSDTASGKNLKDATLANGLTVRVPLFIDSGERIVVDPRTLEFIRRAAR
ncbi:MAG TPA: elongation factor P [Candidatus Polarisedimenticolaceae bacterium]|nr:elongation factor P [Candidatus Polarisedimenticolaceae bacterium]